MGMVYKVCEFRGLPRFKLSEETEKTTIPGSKKIVRAFSEKDEPLFDVLYLADEEVPENSDKIFDRVTGQTYSAPKLVILTQLLFQNGTSELGQNNIRDQRVILQ
jgi:hypothetical protein